MSKNTECMVEGFIRESLLPAMWKAIEMRIMQKRIERHLSRVVSKDMVIDMLDSTTKNSQGINKKAIKEEMKDVREESKPEEKSKVRTKRSKHIQSAFIKSKQQDCYANPQSSYPLSEVKRFSSELIKLPDSTEQQSEEVKSIRVMKQRMRRFQKQVVLRGEKNAMNHHQSSRKKKSVHSQCIYHTYDYQANLVEIEQEQMRNFREKQEGETLLETIKKNLDRQIEEHIAMRKNKQIDDHHRHIHSNVPLNKIQRMDNEPLETKQQRPQCTFEPSNIESLSKNFEKYIRNGVQMVTLQDKIVQQRHNHEKKRFKIIKEKTIHSKITSPKQKTNASQSIIFSLQNNAKNQSTTIDIHSQQSHLSNKYQSLQLDHEDCISKLSQVYIQNGLSRKKSLMQSPCNNPFKLPDIKLRQQRKVSKKRTSTQQKIIKGLDHIGIKTPINHKKLPQSRNGLYSAFNMNKRTQSSMDECDYQSKDKKEMIREYFNNYGKQFRLKKQMLLDNGSNFYSNR